MSSSMANCAGFGNKTHVSKDKLKQRTLALLIMGAFFSVFAISTFFWPERDPPYNFRAISTDDHLLKPLGTWEAALAAEAQLYTIPSDITPPGVNNQQLAACFRLSGLAPVGDVETWFWTLLQYAFSTDHLALHAVSLERAHWLHGYFYGVASFLRLQREVPRINPSPSELQEQCSVIFSTGLAPPASPTGVPAVPSVLVIHGADDAGTHSYAQYINRYDAAVCLTADCASTFQPAADAAGVPLRVIPPAVHVEDFAGVGEASPRAQLHKRHGLPPGAKVLAYTGPISPEKDVQFFVDVAAALPPDWVAVMVGPVFLEGSMPPLHARVKYLGEQTPARDVLAMADAVLLPSPRESGPVELLQGWAARVPCFARRTGLAETHPDAVVDIGAVGARSAAQVAALVVDSTTGSGKDTASAAVEAGFAVVTSRYSTSAVAAQYSKLVESAVRCAARDGVWLDPKPTAALTDGDTARTVSSGMAHSALLSAHGKQVQLQCVQAATCAFELRSSSPPPCALTNWTPKLVRVVFELFGQGSQEQDAAHIAVRVAFAGSEAAQEAEHDALPAPAPVTMQGSHVVVQHAVPDSFAGETSFHVQVPAGSRLHLVRVEWRQSGAE